MTQLLRAVWQRLNPFTDAGWASIALAAFWVVVACGLVGAFR